MTDTERRIINDMHRGTMYSNYNTFARSTTNFDDSIGQKYPTFKDVVNVANKKDPYSATKGENVDVSNLLGTMGHGASAQSIPLASGMLQDQSYARKSEHAPREIPGLTEWLRGEYHRKFGCFVNGARDEETKLIQFWRENISEEARRKRERLQELKREKEMEDKMKDVNKNKDKDELRREANRIMAELNKGTPTGANSIEKAQRPSTTKSKKGSQTMKDGKGPWVAPMIASVTSAKKGETMGGGTKGGAVPGFQVTTNSLLSQQEKFSKESDASVVYTIHEDIRKEQEKETQERLQYEQQYASKNKKEQIEAENAVISKMILLYFFPPLDPSVAMGSSVKKTDKVESPEALKKQQTKGTKGKPLTDTKNADLERIKEEEEDKYEKDEKESSGVFPGLKVKNPANSAAAKPKKPQPTKQELEDMVKTLTTLILTAKEKKPQCINDPEAIKTLFQDSQAHRQMLQDQKTQTLLADFFSAAGFIKRLKLHIDCSKSVTKRKLTLSMYHKQLRPMDRWLNLLDYKESKNNEEKLFDSKNVEEVLLIQADLEKKKAIETEQRKEKRRLAKLEEDKKKREQEKSELDGTAEIKPQLRDRKDMTSKERANKERLERDAKKEYLNNLAKPKDKFEKLRELLRLRKQFPSDMVVRRMIRDEIKLNPDAPAELLDPDQIVTRNIDDRRAAGEKIRKFQDDMAKEAQEFIELSKVQKKRQNEDGVEVMQQALCDVYTKMRLKHREVVKSQYAMDKGAEFTVDKKTLAVKRTEYPEKFRRYFFKKLREVTKREPKLAERQRGVRNIYRKKPLMFINAGSRKCTMHTVSCPLVPCPYATSNKKVALTYKISKKAGKNEINVMKVLAFGKADLREQLKKIFMTNDELDNCQFMPKISKPGKGFEEKDQKTFFEDKFGTNFSKSDASIYKKGKLKKAWREYNEGRYMQAQNTLETAFNIGSLKNYFIKDYYKTKLAEGLKNMMTENKAKRKTKDGISDMFGGRDKSKESDVKDKKETTSKSPEKGLGLMSLLAKGQKKEEEPKKGNIDSLDHMREKTEEKQKTMHQEDFDKKKLYPVLQEAFYLIKLIEDKTGNTQVTKAKLEKQKQKLIDQKKKLEAMDTVAEQEENTKLLFKSIMCPLGDRCPKDNRARWPKSDIKTVTPFGEKCLYAHHYNELEFPETLKTKISAIKTMQNNIGKSAEAEAKSTKTQFKPASYMKDCKGCHNCNFCRFKHTTDARSAEVLADKNQRKYRETMQKKAEEEGKGTTKKPKPDFTTTYIEEMRNLKKEMDLDDNYFKKFGMLKKAAVLLFYERENEAMDEVSKAVEIAKQQRKLNKERMEAIKRRWEFKLGIGEGEIELPNKFLQTHPDQISDKDLLDKVGDSGISLATARLYLTKISPVLNDQYNKNCYLDRCIEDLYLYCESKIKGRMGDIDKIKEKITKLEELVDWEEMQVSGDDEPQPMYDDEGKPIKVKVNKKKMCESLMKTGKCKFTDPKRHRKASEGKGSQSPSKEKTAKVECKFAHNPIELTGLISSTVKINNLQNVVKCLDKSLRNNKSAQDWIPPSHGGIEDLSLFQPYVEEHYKVDKGGDDNEDEEGKSKSVFDKENVFRKPFEDKE